MLVTNAVVMMGVALGLASPLDEGVLDERFGPDAESEDRFVVPKVGDAVDREPRDADPTSRTVREKGGRKYMDDSSENPMKSIYNIENDYVIPRATIELRRKKQESKRTRFIEDRLATAKSKMNKKDLQKVMLIAIQMDNSSAVVECITNGLSVKEPILRGRNVLHVAAVEGSQEAAKAIINKGGDVNAKDKGGYSATVLAVQHGRLEMLKLLADKGADMKATRGSYTLLHDAVLKDDVEVVRWLVAGGWHGVNVQDKDGYSPLHKAAQAGKVQAAQVLVEKSARVDLADKEGFTALHWASIAGHTAIVKLLLDKKASLSAKTKSSYAPLHWAAHGWQPGIVEQLLNRKADVNATNNFGYTALHRAGEEGCYEIARLLVSKGAGINALGADGLTALDKAVQDHRLGLRDLLKAKGAASASVPASIIKGKIDVRQFEGKDKKKPKQKP